MRQYSDEFFDYIQRDARRSARSVIVALRELLCVRSVIDVGSGRGAWLAEWQAAGVRDLAGVDGPYVTKASLLIDDSLFYSADLSQPFSMARKFDLAQSLEVAEHITPSSSSTFVAPLTSLADVVLFSAAVPGQGGEHHINEREPDFWRSEFRLHGFDAFDAVRPMLHDQPAVAPWYRYNLLLYADAAGQSQLSASALATRVAATASIPRAGNLVWRARLGVVRVLPRPLVTWIARWKARLELARQRRNPC